MPSHWQFGHLQPKLWAKEGPGVKLGIDAFPTSDLSVRHGVGKISTRAITSVQTSSRSKSAVESYGGSKFRKSRRDNFGIPFRESREFVPLGCRCGGASQSIL
jgi:hypothetical protein